MVEWLCIRSIGAYLHQHVENVTQKMISSHSEIDTMTTSQILKLLEKKNLIQRKLHPTDTRPNIIELLPEGEVNQAVPLVEKVDEDFFGILKDDESSFIRLLQKLI